MTLIRTGRLADRVEKRYWIWEIRMSFLRGYAAGPREGTEVAPPVYSATTAGRMRPCSRWCYVPVVGSVVRGALRRPRW